MEDINGKVLYLGYGLKLFETWRTKSGLLCSTDKGLKELIKSFASEKSIIFESELKEYILGKGFKGITPNIKTVSGEYYYSLDKTKFCLRDFKNGRPADITQKDELISASRALACFHSLSCGFVSSAGAINSKSALETFKKRRSELKRIKKNIGKRGSMSLVDIAVVKNYSYYIEKAELAINLLSNSGYESIKSSSHQKRMICHNSYKNDNIQLLENGEIFLPGFEKASCDSAVSDIAGFIRYIMKSPEFDTAWVFEALEHYSQARPLSSGELYVIYGLLSFPYKFFKLLNSHYNRRQAYVSDAFIEKLNECIASKEKNELLLNEIRKIAF